MFELHEVVIFVVWSVVVWGMGWYAHKGKCEREKRAEELRLAVSRPNVMSGLNITSLEILENIRLQATRGRDDAQDYNWSRVVDTFQNILDSVQWIKHNEEGE